MSKVTLFLLFVLGIILINKFRKANRAAKMRQEFRKQTETVSKPDGEVLYEKGETKVFKGEAGNKYNEKNL